MRFLLVLATFLFAHTAVGQLSPPNKEVADRCEMASNLSAKIMNWRQSGVPVTKAMKEADGNELEQYIVLKAYDSPRYGTEAFRTRAQVEFSNEMYLECIKFAQK